ncbi:hypothetical protein TI04_08030 [Achromatium sp. WMS2]|nr:hypothetical protein TI04_08030 [Achromatium sp. WMS2]
MSSILKNLELAATTLAGIPGINPRLEAEVLLCRVVYKPRSYLVAWPDYVLTPNQEVDYSSLIQRRLLGEPLAYIVQYRDFWDLKLQITKDVLIPRPDTELLVELALSLGVKGSQTNPNRTLLVADLGTGSGAIAAAIAKHQPFWTVHATDISDTALNVAKNNFRTLNLRITTHLGSWYQALPYNLIFDLIVSNPPYIAVNDPHLTQGDLPYEPRQALVAGADGLDALRVLINNAINYLQPTGMVLLEHGYNQAPAVRSLMRSAGLQNICTWRDLAGHERVTGGYAN